MRGLYISSMVRSVRGPSSSICALSCSHDFCSAARSFSESVLMGFWYDRWMMPAKSDGRWDFSLPLAEIQNARPVPIRPVKSPNSKRTLSLVILTDACRIIARSSESKTKIAKSKRSVAARSPPKTVSFNLKADSSQTVGVANAAIHSFSVRAVLSCSVEDPMKTVGLGTLAIYLDWARSARTKFKVRCASLDPSRSSFAVARS
jgi:hypothetical protein